MDTQIPRDAIVGAPRRRGATSGTHSDRAVPARDPGERGDDDNAGEMIQILVDWYAANARALPWREPCTTPWGVLVSEFMLQQTPVARVLPVWLDWMRRWPAPAGLAGDSPGSAVRAWGRLGYPRRALRLHACAVEITSRYGGQVPAEVDLLLGLPGVGGYTARAVAAFAYRRRVPVVDTNVRRVVARAFGGRADAGAATTVADLAAVERLLPPAGPDAALASAALMELGAVRCTARSPGCAACPWSAACAWRAAGMPAAAGPTRRPQAYAGTDRQVRGLLLAVLRECDDPVPLARLDLVWPVAAQRRRALAGLVADGLVEQDPTAEGLYRLPGSSANVT